MAKADLTAERLRELLDYDPETGVFIWKTQSGRQPAGSVAGWKQYSRIYIKVAGFQIGAHRLAWLYVYGAMPTNQIDHINGDPSDNRIANLRDVTDRENKQNLRKPKAGNKSGYLGVAPNKKRWLAKITVNRQQICLGTYDTPEEAHLAYVEAKRRLHPTCTL
jgi:hypothetical protein